MVRLEVGACVSVLQFKKEFQFQDGTIRSDKMMAVEIISIEFQFQDGTIRSGIFHIKEPLKVLFQFQDGTIRRSRVHYLRRI